MPDLGAGEPACFAGELKEGGTGPSVVSQALEGPEIPDWCGRDAPAKAAAFVGKGPPNQKGWAWRNLFGFYANPPALSTLPDWGCFLFGAKPGKWGQFVLNLVYIPLAILDGLYSYLFDEACRNTKAAPLMLRKAIGDTVSNWVGIDMRISAWQVEATLNYLCPNVLPHPPDVIAAYMHGVMPRPDAVAWLKGHGWCEYTTELAIHAAQYRFGPSELIDLWRRRIITDEAALADRLEKTGVLDQWTRREIIEGSYTLFDVGTIYRALHILRPGRVDDSIVYTENDAKRDLTSLGYNYKQVSQLLYLNKFDISHRQFLMPYKLGQMTTAQLQEAMRDDGWIQRDIDTFTPMYRLERGISRNAEVGGDTPKGLVTAAAEGVITYDELRAGIKEIGYNDLIAEDAVRQAKEQRLADRHKAGIAAVRGGLNAGEYSPDTAALALSVYGIDQTSALEIIGIWQVEAQTKLKPASVGQLCEWASKGWVSVAEYQYRLRALGWRPADIERIIRACGLKERQRQEKQDAANAKRRVDEAKKQAGAEAALLKARASLAAKVAAKKAADARHQADQLLTGAHQQLAQVGSELSHIQTRAKTKGAMIDPAEVAANPPPGPPLPTP